MATHVDSSNIKTIPQCVELLQITMADLAAGVGDATGLQQEFAVVKKAYHKTVLKTHPDKGGDMQAFIAVRTAFEVLKDVFAGGRFSSYTEAAKSYEATTYNDLLRGFQGGPVPPWAYYAAAAEEMLPL